MITDVTIFSKADLTHTDEEGCYTYARFIENEYYGGFEERLSYVRLLLRLLKGEEERLQYIIDHKLPSKELFVTLVNTNPDVLNSIFDDFAIKEGADE